jgi:hypothetical protein
MSEAAPQAAGGTRTDETEQALSYLQLLWGDDHQIGHDEQGYWASPHGQIGRIIRAGSPEQLGALMNGNTGAPR